MAFERGGRGWGSRRKLVGAILAIAFAAFLLSEAAAAFRDPMKPIARYRSAPLAPSVFVWGRVHALAGGALPPLCRVTHQTYVSKSRRSGGDWRDGSWMNVAAGTLEVTGSSSPVPRVLVPSAGFEIDPGDVDPTVVEDPARLAALRAYAEREKLAFAKRGFERSSDERVVERCVADGEPIYAQGCVKQDGDEATLRSCGPALSAWRFVRGEGPQSAIDAAADDLATTLGAAFAALALVPLLLAPRKGTLVAALGDRAGYVWDAWSPRAKSLVLLPVAALAVDVLLMQREEPDTFAYGRGGYVVMAAAVAGAAWVAAKMLARRREAQRAVAPVLAAERKTLANASGTAELSVRARKRGDGVRTVLDRPNVAYAETRVTETYQRGKYIHEIERFTRVASRELDVVDESGEGVLHLEHAVLDVDVRRVSFGGVPRRLAEEGVKLERHENHVAYVVEERAVEDGEALWVLGEVSGLTLRADESGYRSVRGSPSLGGEGVPPVLVFAGDERGLVASLRREARVATALAVLAASCAVAAVVSTALLAWL
jgi:hypothetical protein